MRNRRFLRVAILCFVLATLVAIGGLTAGCADLSPKGDYLAARIWLGDQAVKLADYRDQLPAEEQKKMNAVVVPILTGAKVALEAWGLALAGGQDPTAQIAAWRNVLTQVNNLVTTYLGD